MFRNWVFQNFPFLEDDFDALTDYELFCKMMEYVKNFAKDNEEFKKQIEDLENYVYNLDLQDEVNNKLDEMATDGTLDEIINQNIFNELNDKVDNHYINNLSDTVQAHVYKELTDFFDYDEGWSLSSCIIVGNKGIAVANDWTGSGSSGNKFKIVTFSFINEIISNIVENPTLIDGHANSMCKLNENNVLIAAITHSYIYNLETNTYNETTVINGLTSCSDYNNEIYASIPLENVLYKISYQNNDIVIDETYNISGLANSLNGGSQGMVIYDNKIFYISYAPVSLVIYDLISKKLLRNQLFTAPYISEFEDGFVYNDEIILCDSIGRLFKVDIYDKYTIGGYYNNIITKSLTDICLLDEPIKLTNGNNVTIDFKKFMAFLNNNTNSNIGTLGSQLESITIFMALRNFPEALGIHNLKPVEIPLYKNISYEDDIFNWLAYHWSTSWMEYTSNSIFQKTTITGDYTLGDGDSIPNITISLDSAKLQESWDGTTYSSNVMSNENFEVYITKIIGHRKVGTGY